ncbi:MAG: serine hydrolase [Bacteroidota bacterium]
MMKYRKKKVAIITGLSLFVFILVSFTLFKSNKKITLSDVDAIISPYVESGDFSGIVYVKHEGQVVGQKSYGYANEATKEPIDSQTIFKIGSLSKQFTAAAILLLEQQGKLKTTDLLSKYVHNFPELSQVNLHHLLSHGSGIYDINTVKNYSDLMIRGATLDEALNRIKDKPALFKPGKRYSYSNSNYLLLAKVIEQVSGLSYSEFMVHYIFEPSGMLNTQVANTNDQIPNAAIGYSPGSVGFIRTPYENLEVKTGAGSVVSNIDDMVKWHQILQSEDLLTKSSKKKLFNKQNGDYGYGWNIVKVPFFMHIATHDGRVPGFTSVFVHGVNKDLCLIILANRETAATVSIRNRIQDLSRKGKYDPIFLSKYANILPQNPSEYAGVYTDEAGESFRIVVQDGGISFQWHYDSYPQFLQKAPEKDLFIMRNRGNYCQFERDDSGKVDGMSMGSWKVKKIR